MHAFVKVESTGWVEVVLVRLSWTTAPRQTTVVLARRSRLATADGHGAGNISPEFSSLHLASVSHKNSGANIASVNLALT
jgi:hypothetical protein